MTLKEALSLLSENKNWVKGYIQSENGVRIFQLDKKAKHFYIFPGENSAERPLSVDRERMKRFFLFRKDLLSEMNFTFIK